jgi:hypothetical protein
MAGATQQQAADAVGVSRQTFNEWCTKTPLFIAERQTGRMLRTQHHADAKQIPAIARVMLRTAEQLTNTETDLISQLEAELRQH